MKVNVKDQNFQLLPEKAILWEEKATLIVADLHLGKITHFRKSGIALPRQAEDENYERLSYLILNHNVRKVLILGDLFHSRANSEWDGFKKFLENFPKIQFDLVVGNHDILPKSYYEVENLKLCAEELELAPFIFSHFPMENSKMYNICGHVHPAIRMKGLGRQRLTLPCFYFGESQAILPAYGVFTGTHCVEPRSGDDIYIVSEGTIIKVS